jgi:hypothetical protein
VDVAAAPTDEHAGDRGVTTLHKLDAILPAVKALEKRHRGYGVTAAHCAPVGAMTSA